MKNRAERYELRRLRVRRKIFGTPERPRLSVYKSLKHIYVQVIDDLQGKTLAAASSIEKGIGKGNGVKKALSVGEKVAKRAIEKGVKKVVMDRGASPFHGRIKAVGDGARQAGLEF